MASKRGLYKPATLQNIDSQEQRRSLAQGRLVSKPVLPDTMTVYASPMDVSQTAPHMDTGDLSVTLPHGGYPLDGEPVTPPRQSLARVMTSYTPTSDTLTSRQSTQGHLPGRSDTAPPLSPSKPMPSALLELSDTENEAHYSAMRPSSVRRSRNLTPSPVLYVDASGGRVDPERSEVVTNTDLVISPAKVICHAPAVVESDLRNTGYTQETARIKVDAVPTVSLLGDLDVTQVKGQQRSTPASAGKSQGRARTPLVVKENSVAGVSYNQSESSKIEDRSGDQDEKPSIGAKTESAVKDKKKKNVGKGKMIPSRYMQAASKPTSVESSSVGDTTIVPPRPRHGSTAASSRGKHGKKAVQIKSSHAKRVASVSGAHQPITKPAPKHQVRSRSATQSQYSYTPMAHGIHRGGGVTSTPAVRDTMVPAAGNWDASAIGLSMVQGHDVSMAMAPASGVAVSLASRLDSTRNLSHQDELSTGDVSVFQSVMSNTPGQDSAYASLPTTHKKRHPADITQDYLDKVYARYIQAVYLDSKLEKTLKDQEKECMSQMYGLWHENEKLQTKKRDLELELASSQHANHLDQQLDVQISGLGPVVTHLDQLKSQYSTLAHALDTTRHQLATTGIHTPQDEDSYHESLVDALAESTNLLGEINIATRAHQPQVASFASAIQALQKAVDNEDKELKRCQELLSATCTLATQEASLRIQQIEQ